VVILEKKARHFCGGTRPASSKEAMEPRSQRPITGDSQGKPLLDPQIGGPNGGSRAGPDLPTALGAGHRGAASLRKEGCSAAERERSDKHPPRL